MCGIAGIHRLGADITELPVERLAQELMLGLELRGRDATGWLTLDDRGSARIRKDVLPAIRFVKRMKEQPKRWGIHAEDIRTLLVHTRWATIGNHRDPKNAHPHAAGNIAAVHNGTIFNADEIFNCFDLKRRASVDSEVVPALVNEFGWENALDALELLDGGAALALVSSKHPNELLLARVHDFPLHWVANEDVLIWASTPTVIERAVDRALGKTMDEMGFHDGGFLVDGDAVRVVDGRIDMTSFRPMERFIFPTKRKKGRVAIGPAKSKKQKAAEKATKRHLRSVPAPSTTTTMGWERRADDILEQDIQDFMDDCGCSWSDAEEALNLGWAEDIRDMMDEGVTFNQAWDVCEETADWLDDLDITGRVVVSDADWHELDDTPHGKKTTRGHVVTKSPATLAEEALS